MRYPPGDRFEVVVEMAGRPHGLWMYAPGGKENPKNGITVHEVDYIRATPNVPASDDPAARSYGPVGQPGYPPLGYIDTDRPGPIMVAEDVVCARMIVSCPVWCNIWAS